MRCCGCPLRGQKRTSRRSWRMSALSRERKCSKSSNFSEAACAVLCLIESPRALCVGRESGSPGVQPNDSREKAGPQASVIGASRLDPCGRGAGRRIGWPVQQCRAYEMVKLVPLRFRQRRFAGRWRMRSISWRAQTLRGRVVFDPPHPGHLPGHGIDQTKVNRQPVRAESAFIPKDMPAVGFRWRQVRFAVFMDQSIATRGMDDLRTILILEAPFR